MLTWQCDVTLGLTWQDAKHSRCVEHVGAWASLDWRVRRVRSVVDTDGVWRRVERMLVRQKLQPAHVM